MVMGLGDAMEVDRCRQGNMIIRHFRFRGKAQIIRLNWRFVETLMSP